MPEVEQTRLGAPTIGLASRTVVTLMLRRHYERAGNPVRRSRIGRRLLHKAACENLGRARCDGR
jgi:hypothetical protein